jgi:RNA polymerase sigma factor (sigma-70 family)
MDQSRSTHGGAAPAQFQATRGRARGGEVDLVRVYMDAVQAGNIGLLRAVEGYDWRLGYRFSTYASWWVRQAIVRELAEAGRGVHLPALVREEISTLARTRDRLRTQEGREPGAQALADALGWTRGRVSELLVLAQATVSLSVPVGDGGGPELAELLADEEVVDPSDSVADGSRREDVARLVDGLGGHQAAVLRLRYGLDGSAPRSMEQVGKVLGLSRERVRQLEGHALRRLREDDGARSLRPVG